MFSGKLWAYCVPYTKEKHKAIKTFLMLQREMCSNQQLSFKIQYIREHFIIIFQAEQYYLGLFHCSLILHRYAPFALS
jgi:hypothetical protein